jgi:glycosyltransferase involved in cell wall biosynthesis
MKPLVSVLIITYNHEDYIAQTLDSVLNQQTNFDFEVVVGDDCSKDRTVEILNAYAQRHTNVRVLTTAKNLGVVPNCIRTLTACQGKYVAHLDGDDYWIDNLKLQKQFDRLEADANMTICYTARKVFREDDSSRNQRQTSRRTRLLQHPRRRSQHTLLCKGLCRHGFLPFVHHYVPKTN